jgi:predicted negative regulator of RcsB-dependent stress response
MAYDHEEQEQLDALKAWWKQYGNQLTWLVIAVLAAFSAWRGWGLYQAKQSAQAATLYEQVQNAVTAKDQAKVARAAADIEDKFAATYYAQMAALSAAKFSFDSGDLKSAKTQYGWVIEHGQADQFKAVARIRLAAVLLDEKSYDDALKQLSGEFPAEFVAAAADAKGDIYVAQNKIDDARTAYQSALDKGTDKSPAYNLVQLKLDAIGGPKTVAAK